MNAISAIVIRFMNSRFLAGAFAQRVFAAISDIQRRAVAETIPKVPGAVNPVTDPARTVTVFLAHIFDLDLDVPNDSAELRAQMLRQAGVREFSQEVRHHILYFILYEYTFEIKRDLCHGGSEMICLVLTEVFSSWVRDEEGALVE